MELSVAVMLIVLGVMNIAGFVRSMPVATHGTEHEAIVHTHPHRHGDFIHTHPHSHEPEGHSPLRTGGPLAWLDGALGTIGVYQYLRPFVVGIVHGLAGSAAVALLVLTTIRDSHWAIAYLLLFGVGTIAGMMLITLGIASTLRVVAGRRQSVSRTLAMASGLLSMVFGLVVAYQICVVSGLFTGHAQWTPH
jgi:high-affinity nickel-transport protein